MEQCLCVVVVEVIVVVVVAVRRGHTAPPISGPVVHFVL